MKKRKRIFIAEDHRILREGLRSLLESGDDFEVAGEAENGLDAVRGVEHCNPDLILLDLTMPKMNGIEVIKTIRRQSPATRILVLTIHESEEYVLEAFGSGVDGYCLKDASHTELFMAMKSVLSGKPYISPGISENVLEGYLEGRKTLKSGSSWDTLTPREREVLRRIGESLKNKEIADHLCISVKTVEKHRANVMKKLDLHSASALTAYAIEKGLVG